MTSYALAWSKLFLANADLVSTEADLISRVRAAYWHLAPLNSTNVPPETFERLKAVRAEFARSVSISDEDDGTISLSEITLDQAAFIASEILSMFDEVAKGIGAEKIASALAGVDLGSEDPQAVRLLN